MRWFIVGVLVLAGCGRDDGRPPVTRSMTVTTSAPPTGLRATLGPLVVTGRDGKPGPLGDRMRDVTVLAFWASWCHPCLDELPQLDRFYAAETDKRVAVIAVNIDAAADRPAALAVIDKLGVHVPVVFDPGNAIYTAVFNPTSTTIPALAIVAPDGLETDEGYEPHTDAEFTAGLRLRVDKHVH